jgi:hypothetical protein
MAPHRTAVPVTAVVVVVLLLLVMLLQLPSSVTQLNAAAGFVAKRPRCSCGGVPVTVKQLCRCAGVSKGA